MRTAKSITNGLGNCKFTARVGDKLSIIQTPGIISNSIELKLTNQYTNENIDFCVDNIPAAWEWLKAVNGLREVVVLRDGLETPFKDSAPYKARF